MTGELTERRRERHLQQQLKQQKGQQQPDTQVRDTAHQGKFDWLKHHLTNARPILTSLIMFFLGSGAMWQYLHLDIQRENQANEIRKEIITLHEKIIDVTNSQNEAVTSLSGGELVEKTRPLQRRLEFYLEEYNKWESKLAQIEGRPPKHLDVIPPTAPHSISVK